MVEFKDLIVPSDISMLDAMRAIDRGSLQFALVADEGILKGLVTDGDIRRALMRGVGTSAPIHLAMNANPVRALLSEPRQEWRRKIREHRIKFLPVVDAAGRLLRVVTEQTCVDPRENWAVIMAGGLGTRLRPYTEEVPKPMIEIGGTPILETILRSLTSSGITRVFLSVNYRAEVIIDYFGDGRRFDTSIEYLRENERLGTAGALSLLKERPDQPLLVMNGDVLTGLHYGDVLDEHARCGAMATMCVREYATQIPYGVVEVDGDDLRGITEKPTLTHLMSAGIYALSAGALAHVPTGCYFDMPALFQRLMADGERVRVHRIDDYWIDIGRIDDLERARADAGKRST